MLSDERGVKFHPAEYIRGFSDVQIVEHLEAVCKLVEEIDPPADLRLICFQVAQQMRATMEPRTASKIQAVPASVLDGIVR